MLFNDLLAQRQPDAGTLKLAVIVKSLEHAEDLLCIFLFEADAIVFHKDPAILVSFRSVSRRRHRRHFRMNSNDRRNVLLAVLQGIGDEVLEQRTH